MTDQHHHLFVSYASVDDDPMPGVATGWVTQLVRGIKTSAIRRLGRRDDLRLWMDYELVGNDAITPVITEALTGSDCILLILSPGYLASDWCQRELRGFLDRHAIDSGRVFMVEPEPVDKPEALHDLKGFRLYETTPEGKVTRLGWPQPDPSQLGYYQKVDDLGQAIADRIRRLEADRAQQTTEAVVYSHTVLLAPVTDDLAEPREQLRRALEQQQIRVLPASGYYPPQAIEASLQADLAEAELYVQLLSPAVGMGIPATLGACAQGSGRPTLLWHAEGIDPTRVADPAHRALLQDPELMVSDLVELQRQIQRRLQPPPPAIQPPEGDLFLFVNHAPEDGAALQPLLEELERRNIGYALPLTTEEAGSIAEQRQDLEQNLIGCDAMLMLYHQAPATWAREQLMLWRKNAIKREQPARGIGLCKGPANPLSMRLPGLQLIDCAGDRPRDCLDRLGFLNGGVA